MPTYATAADVAAVTDLAEDDVTDELIERAERELDEVLGPIAVRTDTGLKLNPDSLLAYERKALARAVAVQAEHIAANAPTGERTVVEEAGPDFRLKYAEDAAPAGTGRFSPRLPTELAPIRHLRRLAVAGA